MNFKRELHKDYNLKNFSNAGLKMTEVLHAEKLCEVEQDGLA